MNVNYYAKTDLYIFCVVNENRARNLIFYVVVRRKGTIFLQRYRSRIETNTITVFFFFFCWERKKKKMLSSWLSSSSSLCVDFSLSIVSSLCFLEEEFDAGSSLAYVDFFFPLGGKSIHALSIHGSSLFFQAWEWEKSIEGCVSESGLIGRYRKRCPSRHS